MGSVPVGGHGIAELVLLHRERGRGVLQGARDALGLVGRGVDAEVELGRDAPGERAAKERADAALGTGERGLDLLVAIGVAAHVRAQVALVDGDLDARDRDEREGGVGDLKEEDVGELDARLLVGPSRVLVLLHLLLQKGSPPVSP